MIGLSLEGKISYESGRPRATHILYPLIDSTLVLVPDSYMELRGHKHVLHFSAFGAWRRGLDIYLSETIAAYAVFSKVLGHAEEKAEHELSTITKALHRFERGGQVLSKWAYITRESARTVRLPIFGSFVEIMREQAHDYEKDSQKFSDLGRVLRYGSHVLEDLLPAASHLSNTAASLEAAKTHTSSLRASAVRLGGIFQKWPRGRQNCTRRFFLFPQGHFRTHDTIYK
jgi:hypothetical protein